MEVSASVTVIISLDCFMWLTVMVIGQLFKSSTGIVCSSEWVSVFKQALFIC